MDFEEQTKEFVVAKVVAGSGQAGVVSVGFISFDAN